MADLNNPMGIVGGELVGKILSSVIWIIGIFIIGGLVLGIFLYVRYRRQFDIQIKIQSERAEDKFSVIFDRGAILTDKKTKVKYLKLFNQKVELEIPPFNILQTSNKGDYVEIWRKSELEYYFLTPPKISKTEMIKKDGKLYPMANVEQVHLTSDMLEWLINRIEKHKNIFDTEHWLMKIIPYIPQIIGGILIIFTLYVLFDSLPAVLSALTELTKQLTSLKTAELRHFLPLIK